MQIAAERRILAAAKHPCWKISAFPRRMGYTRDLRCVPTTLLPFQTVASQHVVQFWVRKLRSDEEQLITLMGTPF